MNVEHFYCYGSFGPDPENKNRPFVDEEKVSQFLANLHPETTDILVHIRSKGGSYDVGFNIYDLFANCGKNVDTIIEGECHSIATIPLLAGKNREILPHSKVGIHNPWIDGKQLDGMQSSQVLEVGSDMLTAEQRMLDFYASHTGTDKQIIKQLMDEDKPFDAATALELKFVTKIAEPRTVRAFAYLTPKIQNENNMSKEIKSLGEKLMAKIDAVLDFASGKSKTLEIKAEGEETTEVKAESFTTAEGVTINIDGGLVEGSAVTSAEGTVMPDASITLEDGTVITTDADSKIKTVTAKVEDPNQAAINAAVATATAAMSEELATLKAEKEILISNQAAMSAKIDLIAKNVKSTFELKKGDTKFQNRSSEETKKSAPTREEMDAKAKSYKK